MKLVFSNKKKNISFVYGQCTDGVQTMLKAEDEYEVHEVQFLKIRTSNGDITFETHNIHNGYYGGFYIELTDDVD